MRSTSIMPSSSVDLQNVHQRTFLFLRISQSIFVLQRDFWFFWRLKSCLDSNSAIFVSGRIGNTPKIGHFCEKTKKSCKKHSKKHPKNIGRKWPKLFRKKVDESFNIIVFRKKFLLQKSCPTSKILLFSKIWSIFVKFS